MWSPWCIVVYRMNMFTSYHYVANSWWHQVKHSLHNVTTSKHSVLLYTYNSHIYIYIHILFSQTLGAAFLISLLIAMISLIQMCMYTYTYLHGIIYGYQYQFWRFLRLQVPVLWSFLITVLYASYWMDKLLAPIDIPNIQSTLQFCQPSNTVNSVWILHHLGLQSHQRDVCSETGCLHKR